jgi:cell shape-determining protein MreC
MNKHIPTHSTTFTGFRREKKHKDKRKVLLTSMFFVFLVLILSWKIFSQQLGAMTAFIGSPVIRLSQSSSALLKHVGVYIKSKEDLAEENSQLEKKIEQQYLETFELAGLRKENASLKQALGRLPDDKSFVLARILVSPLVSPYDTMLIDLGMYEGVGQGMVVYYEGGFAIGEVDTAYRHSALVSLYSRSGSEMPVYIGAESVPAMAYGVGGGNFRISLPKGTEVAAGDSIAIPGFSPTYVGVVDEDDSSENSSFSTLYTKLPFDYQRIQSVYVAIPTNSRDKN